MKIFLNIIGTLAVLLGAGWAFQGLKIINYGVMAGHRRWIVIGALLVVIGVVVLIFNNRNKVKG